MGTEKTKKPKITWLKHYKAEATKPDFDVKKFAGRLAFQRMAIAKKAIHSIATPFFSNEAELPCSEDGIAYLEDQLHEAVEAMASELRAGRRSATKETGVVPF
jgi:hypothetical protein